MKMEFDFEAEECAEVMAAVALRMQSLLQQPATPETHTSLRRLKRFAKKMGPVIHQGMAEESENIGRLN